MDEENIRTLDWPGNSPDLNPIENFWSEMAKKVVSERPRTKSELQRLLINAWYKEISIEYVQKLVNPMPPRVQAVIKAKGGHPTKY